MARQQAIRALLAFDSLEEKDQVWLVGRERFPPILSPPSPPTLRAGHSRLRLFWKADSGSGLSLADITS